MFEISSKNNGHKCMRVKLIKTGCSMDGKNAVLFIKYI